MNSYEEILEQLQTVRDEIAELQERIIVLRRVRKRLESKIYDGRTFEQRGYDSHYIAIADIRPTIRRWIELYDFQNGKGGQKLLGDRSKVSTRIIRRVLRDDAANKKYITLQTADRLLTAVGAGEKLHEIEIFARHHQAEGFKKVPDPPPSQYFEE